MNLSGAEGAEVIYSLKNNSNFSKMILNNIGKKGQIIRKVYQRRLPENPDLDYYYILRETNSNEPVLIEYGFIDNKNDSERLKTNIEDYAEAVVESIATYLGYPYNNNSNDYEYTVKKGDTLYSISKNYGISIDEIKRINNLETDILSIGQILKLKEFDNNPVYIVQKGDTLYSIAKRYDTSVDELKSINNLYSNTLTIGQKIYIPETSKTEEEIEYDIYTVKKGDSLWKISRKYDISIPELLNINNLTDLSIQVNQKILVPKVSNTDETYIVQKGDSLWSIANKFNKTVNELKELNNLTNNMLLIGQELKI